MEYVINVAKRAGFYSDGTQRFAHYCKVEVSGDDDRAREVYADLCKRFPEAEGFGLSLTRWIKSGQEMARRDVRDWIAA